MGKFNNKKQSTVSYNINVDVEGTSILNKGVNKNMNLAEALDNTSVTENGMTGFKSAGEAYTDFMYKVSSFRNIHTEEGRKAFVADLFKSELNKDKSYLLKFIIYLRDPRNGLGERELGRYMLSYLFSHYVWDDKSQTFDFILKNLFDYGRWDDLFEVFCKEYTETNRLYYSAVFNYCRKTLENDLKLAKNNKSVTLLAKWMPSINTSSEETRKLARRIIKTIGWTEKKYRKTLTYLRNYLKVVEHRMSANEWDKIDYGAVPSLANIRYKDAFMSHDRERRTAYLKKLSTGEAKINSKVNFPHDVVHAYSSDSWWEVKDYDETLEQLWKNLPEIKGFENTLVVRDDSGSMTSTIGGTRMTALDVATGLGIYCAEHCGDSYKNKIISFSDNPKYLDFSNKRTLHDKLEYLRLHSEVGCTNIEKVFELILSTAVRNHLKQEDLPKQIIIISDMEFDEGCNYSRISNPIEQAQIEFRKYGYQVPRLIFWNVNGRTNTIPVTQNKLGVWLISGFSPRILDILDIGLENQEKALLELLDEKFKEIPYIENLSENSLV